VFLLSNNYRKGEREAPYIEVWFELDGHTLYMLSGGRGSSDWVKNISRSPEVVVRIGDYSFRGLGRVVEDPRRTPWPGSSC